MLSWGNGGPFFRFDSEGGMTIHENELGASVRLTQEQWVALYNHLRYEVGDKDGRIVYP